MVPSENSSPSWVCLAATSAESAAVEPPVVKMPPPVAQQFANLLRPDVVVAATGYGTRNQYGEALQAIAFGTPGNVTQLYNDIPN